MTKILFVANLVVIASVAGATLAIHINPLSCGVGLGWVNRHCERVKRAWQSTNQCKNHRLPRSLDSKESKLLAMTEVSLSY
ncbi:hypothetical protein [Helicobacter sp. T3_23-1056]